MSRTESTTTLALGSTAPAFELLDVISGKALSRDDIFATSDGTPREGLIVAFICVHCPFVIHVEQELARIGHDYYGADGEGPIAIVAISSNDIVDYPQDAPEHMREQAQRLGFTFPYLHDESQEVAREYDAACTPDIYFFDPDLRLVYHGQLDSSRPKRKDGSGNDIPVDGKDLRAAIEAVIAGNKPSSQQIPSIGCNIKWRE